MHLSKWQQIMQPEKQQMQQEMMQMQQLFLKEWAWLNQLIYYTVWLGQGLLVGMLIHIRL